MYVKDNRLSAVQWILFILSGMFFLGAIISAIAIFFSWFGAEQTEFLSLFFWILLMISDLLVSCGLWEDHPIYSTVKIAITSFLLGGVVFLMIFK